MLEAIYHHIGGLEKDYSYKFVDLLIYHHIGGLEIIKIC
ncbi:hypothetical protein [uncultured Gammaproteobacteria bacterium]|nr:hypothetical protein [uncultured Gammaproteobacteria bacterium]CAC9587486.1 hypothetical protein [uncultured Gammaproteobacteria bacterium]CAC9966453.1 hypothetical protein [uncultured Gammaproteobacteria bacterium]